MATNVHPLGRRRRSLDLVNPLVSTVSTSLANEANLFHLHCATSFEMFPRFYVWTVVSTFTLLR